MKQLYGGPELPITIEEAKQKNGKHQKSKQKPRKTTTRLLKHEMK